MGFRNIKSKKGSIWDIIIISVVIFAGAMVFQVVNNSMSDVIPEISTELASSPEAVDALDASTDVMGMFDTVFFAVAIGFILAIILSSFLINVHPAFFWIFVLFVSVSAIVAVPLSNAYETLTTELGSAGTYPMMDFLMTNYPVFVVAAGVIAIVVIYAKTR